MHVTPLFINLHWLPIAAQCIKFKALMFAYRIGLCNVDKKKLSRFLDFFFDFDFNHDFDTNRHALQL